MIESGKEPRSDALILAAITALALGLRLANAWCASLHLDDFHSLFHARAASLAEFFSGALQDNHPPLFFLVMRAARSLLGEGEFALRLPAVLCGAATVPLVWRLARRLDSRATQITAALLFACSSLNLELSADLRMYSLLTLAFAGFLEGLIELLERGRGIVRTAVWAFVGLHTHYHFVHCLVVTVAAAAVVLLWRPEVRRHLRSLVLALGIAGLFSLPWYALGFPAQLRHGLPPGGSAISPQRFLEGMVHLEYLNVRLGGPVLRWLFVGCGAIVLGLALLTGARIFLRRRAADGSPAELLLAAGAFALPAWSSAVAWLWPRAGYEWRYIAAAVAPLVVLVALGAHAPGRFHRLRVGAAGLAIVAALWLSVLNVFDPGREDNRRAVGAILARARPGDAVVAAEWQPRIFPHSGAWNYYAPRLLGAGQSVPLLLAHCADFSFPPGTDLSPYRRVFFFGRSIPNQVPLLLALRAEFGQETVESFGMSIQLVTFERSGSGG